MFTQVARYDGVIRRVARGTVPVVELHLRRGQYIAAMTLAEHRYDAPERKTVDWSWSALVVTPLPADEDPRNG